MIYVCADDYGLCEASSARILNCVTDGALNKVSVFPNFDSFDLEGLFADGVTHISLHLNLVEGKCLSDPKEIPLIADENGNFKYSFVGLLKLSLLKKKEMEAQVKKEIRAQVLFWKNRLPEGAPFLIDSHQHTYMIPAIFCALVDVLKEENITVKYFRIPAEPILPYIKCPSLYFSYKPTNLIKQWLLKFLWLFDKKHLHRHPLPTADFMGILFSGEMEGEKILKVLPHYIKAAQKKGRDVEILFHTGYLSEGETEFEERNVVFKDFYLSKNRKKEFDTVTKTSVKEAIDYALH